jgi:hypothetical protein
VEQIIRKGGALSFPHTYISTSLDPLARIVKAIYGAEKSRIMALGVLHTVGAESIKNEFSLDGLRFVTNECADMFHLPLLEIDEIYINHKLTLRDGYDNFLETLERRAEEVKRRMDGNSALVLTGDLFHFGHGYGKRYLDHNESQIWNKVDELLDLVYGKKDYRKYVDLSLDIWNDQYTLGIASSKILGSPLSHRIFSRQIADYSEVLESEKPTSVVSVFYGVYPE